VVEAEARVPAATHTQGEVEMGRSGDWGQRTCDDEPAARVSILDALLFFLYVPVKKNGWPRFVARKIRRLTCSNRCEIPYGDINYTFRYECFMLKKKAIKCPLLAACTHFLAALQNPL
jgi:hypothetical protein